MCLHSPVRKDELREEPLVSDVHHNVNDMNTIPLSKHTQTTDVAIRGDDLYYVSVSV